MPTSPRPLFLAATVLALVTLGGCTDSKPGQSDAVVPRWLGSTDLVIGSLDGAHDQFGGISGIATDRNGRIFVADGDNNTVVAFDSAGRYLYNIGRKGSGPGEFSGPCCPGVDAQGRLWVRDAFNARYNVYTPGATEAPLAETRKMTPGAGAVWARLTFDREGRLVDVITRMREDRMQLLRLHLDSTGTEHGADTITAPPNDSLGVYQFALSNGVGFLSQPYGPRLLIDHAPGGGYARAISSRYLVTWVQPGDSAAVRTIRRDMIGPALSARERQEADSAFRAEVAGTGAPAGSVPFGVPGSKTPIRAVMFDQQGRLWVQLNVGDGENNRADVWDASGRRVGNAEWPSDVDLRQGVIDDTVAYGVRQDPAGVPQVVRIRFAGTGPSSGR